MLAHIGDAWDVHGLATDRIVRMKQEYQRQCVQLGNKPIGCKTGWK